MKVFSGSYLATDVEILLKPIQIPTVSIEEKEYLIQTGEKHYSELISAETLPSTEYLSLFYHLLTLNRQRLATDLIRLAIKIHQSRDSQSIVLVSLVRAGTPIGILLKRILQSYLNCSVKHYAISIIRDLGIDYNALNYILTQHSEQELIFIDGWTGKGVISATLKKSIAQFNQQYQRKVASDLYVLNDIAGVATVCASFDDYIVPSGLLNSTISGLISRSILNKNYLNAADFHGCLYYQQFESADLSQWFIEQMMVEINHSWEYLSTMPINHYGNPIDYQKQLSLMIQYIQQHYEINNVHLIKPGISEATRVLLRRKPYLLLLKNKQAEETKHLQILAHQKQVPIIENCIMPYQAIAIIADIHHD
ncbi:MAG: hypothetical protein RL637_1394 [Pseudomonadota bacterium]|jgi:hypothetical protein